MARSIITDEQWRKAREYYEHGLSLSDIERKTGISRGGISKKSNQEGWDKESPKKHILSQAVEVTELKATLKETVSLEIHNELHDEQTRHLTLINDNATKLSRKLSKMADEIDSPSDLRTLVEANDKLAITLKVADRHAKSVTAVQVNAEAPIESGMGNLYKKMGE